MSEVMQYSNKSPDIQISNTAKKRMLDYMATQGECKAIRLSVKKTGCSGLSYVIDYVKAPFDQDIIIQQPDCLICIDKNSYPYLKGMSIDYVKQGLGHKFIYTNPNQTGQCGCGESFTVGKNT